ncbi:DUF2853 family protein [Nocardioides sp.]|uniref:DUF2853 family protein n=1 Tax=Nocardioides sp. TaxID=35761 RepID=UPI002BA93923|nr:DUF2853 family protein [Nocardioides sp.]HSX67627.1 DUF2853 family protein [Nocardioides sp.]
MAADWAADVRKYVANPDEDAIAGLLKSYRLVMSSADSRYVALSDADERDTVKKNFLTKKLGLADADGSFDAALDEVAAAMKADRTKSRITVYYLLAEAFGKLDAVK